MQPKHIRRVVEKNGEKTFLNYAVAPYNFIELPGDVVSVKKTSLAPHSCYQGCRFTGKIKCLMTTSSPLYVRCGLSLPDFQKAISASIEDLEECSQDERARRVDFFKYPQKSFPVIPGSSLRGMLRSLVEIISFSKIERVSDESRLFFRAVAGTKKQDSLAKAYKEHVSPEYIKAGYLKKDEKGWYIQPAKRIEGFSFAWVREKEISINNFKKFNSECYEPQYFPVSYKSVSKEGRGPARRLFAKSVCICEHSDTRQAFLVTSGNMKQDSEPSPRKNHCIVFEETKESSMQLRINGDAVKHYCNALTEFQRKSPFSQEMGFLKEGRPVFYSQPKSSEIVDFFGQSPNFRIPYSPFQDGRASTVVDFIPENLRKIENIDIADSLFGFVQTKPNKENSNAIFEGGYRGRISVSDAKYIEDLNGIWFSNPSIIPQILGAPKPTAFPHYLVQPEETCAAKKNLKHYSSRPPLKDNAGKIRSGETVIRGHKLYWHKGNIQLSEIQQTQQQKIAKAKSQYTEITPVKDGVTFEFTVQFENLNSIELGALLWVLKIAQDDRYRLSLGMGKPLGMGAVKIEHQIYLSDRVERYTRLFTSKDDAQWYIAETLVNDREEDWLRDFEQYILENISDSDHPEQGKATCLEDLPRIKMLLAMLSWKDNLTQDELNERRYMEIERDTGESHVIGKSRKAKNGKVNEYKERPVLPTPLQIMEFDDDRRIPSKPKAQNQQQVKREKPSKKLPKSNNRKPNNSHNKGDNNSSPTFQRGPKPPRK